MPVVSPPTLHPGAFKKFQSTYLVIASAAFADVLCFFGNQTGFYFLEESHEYKNFLPGNK